MHLFRRGQYPHPVQAEIAQDLGADAVSSQHGVTVASILQLITARRQSFDGFDQDPR